MDARRCRRYGGASGGRDWHDKMSNVTATEPAADGSLRRAIDWRGAFWVASGVPPFVLFSIGGIAATVGPPSWLVWTCSILMGFVQSFIYAEIAGLFANKAGGASVYGAAAWIRYGRWLAPFSVWVNWVAWTPVMTLAAATGAGYLRAFFPADSGINSWQVTLLDLGLLKDGLLLRLDATWLFGVILLLIAFAGQYRGILNAARIQTIVGILVVVPLLVIGLVPLLAGDVRLENLGPVVPVMYGSDGSVLAGGAWNNSGWTLMLGGMFAAAWSTYSFETSVCYTREFKDPARDTAKAILYSGTLCLIMFLLVPLVFQGALGVAKMLEPGIYDGSGVAAAVAGMVGGGPVVGSVLVAMMIFGLLLTIMTAMAGTCRTQYQASVDGWFPRYLSRVNRHGAPTRAMVTDLVVNMILLAFSDYLFVLAVSCCSYLTFNFLNLNAGWLHRIDNAHIRRPWRAPTPLLALGTVFAFVNAAFLGGGAEVWGPNTLLIGLAAMALIVPIFAYRHYLQDRGRFPPGMLHDLGIPDGSLGERRAGILPYLALAGGVAIAVVAALTFGLP